MSRSGVRLVCAPYALRCFFVSLTSHEQESCPTTVTIRVLPITKRPLFLRASGACARVVNLMTPSYGSWTIQSSTQVGSRALLLAVYGHDVPSRRTRTKSGLACKRVVPSVWPTSRIATLSSTQVCRPDLDLCSLEDSNPSPDAYKAPALAR